MDELYYQNHLECKICYNNFDEDERKHVVILFETYV